MNHGAEYPPLVKLQENFIISSFFEYFM